LAVVAIVPAGPLICFHVQQRTYRVARYWGPERIETGWWRGRSVRRDYYRVETDGGLWFWIFRHIDDGQWFLHGMFG
jgi:protein ImuB